jgi:hypothetical protein
MENTPLLSSIPTQSTKICRVVVFVILLICLLSWIVYLGHLEIYSDKQSETTKYVYIIRHCEKYKNKDMGLSKQGIIHSNYLVDYFKNFTYGAPKVIYAETSRTERSIDTGIPLSIELHIPMFNYWRSNDITNVANIVMNNLNIYQHVLIIWEHHYIPLLATKLGCKTCTSWNKNPTSYKTDDTLYYMTWILKYTSNDVEFNYDPQNFTDIKIEKINHW